MASIEAALAEIKRGVEELIPKKSSLPNSKKIVRYELSWGRIQRLRISI